MPTKTPAWLDPFMTNIRQDEVDIHILAGILVDFDVYTAEPRLPCPIREVGLYTRNRTRDHSLYWREVERLRSVREY